MKLSDLPARFNIPFANSAGGGYVRPIPEASQVGVQAGAASLTTGFPPLNWLPTGAGGVPPFGQDMNGIIRWITEWSRWQGAGGLVPYDAAYSAAVGGYPLGALLTSPTANIVWLNTVDDNTTNPDAGGAGWVLMPTAPRVQTNYFNYSAAGGTANALTASMTPAVTAYSAGLTLFLKTGVAANSGAMTINAGAGVVPLLSYSGSALSSGDVPAGSLIDIGYDGAAFRLLRLAISDVRGIIGTTKSPFNTSTQTNTTRTVLSGTGFVNFSTGAYVKTSSTSMLKVSASTNLFSSAVAAAGQMRVTVDGNSYTIICVNITTTSNQSSPNGSTIVTGLPAGTRPWSIDFGRTDGLSWTSTINPNSTDTSNLPPAGTNTSLEFQEIEP